MTRVSIKTIGCKLNQSESDTITNLFKEKGYEIIPFGEPADITVINTCTVTHAADRDGRNMIRHAKRVSPKAKIIVIGCYAEVAEEDIKKLPEVDIILGNKNKLDLFKHLPAKKHVIPAKAGIQKSAEILDPCLRRDDNKTTQLPRTRAFLKIQEGCNFFCAYCIVPFARGGPESLPLNQIIEDAKKIIDQGQQEIVVTGINIGLYEEKCGDKINRLEDVLDHLQKLDGLKRIRTSSVEPNTIRETLFELTKNSNIICPHFHIPLQSGCSKTLTDMKRRYTLEEFESVMTLFKKHLPEGALGTDVIVGFPGETDDDFEKTYNFVKNQPFTYLHVFSYSDRKGTVASEIKNKVHSATIKERSKRLRALGQDMKKNYIQKFVGKNLMVHFDNRKDNKMLGYTHNYIRVGVTSDHIQRGDFRETALISYDSNTELCFGNCPPASDSTQLNDTKTSLCII